jgi:hypothetical protein
MRFGLVGSRVVTEHAGFSGRNPNGFSITPDGEWSAASLVIFNNFRDGAV